ncbi:MAG: class I SAM-dependent methyltransferase [Candidatus Firestonebacteria bacterium]|nr:class I SAM-dependent methyltransferase [Candidatus Firestonebacteria bacterium]
MSTKDFDPKQYKLSQQKQWNSVAAGWKKWWKTFEKSSQKVSDTLVEFAVIKDGYRVLDIATGVGEPAFSAAIKVGKKGTIIATDQSSQMLAIAEERAGTLGLKNISFKEMDAEILNFPKNSFDAIICRWGLMFLPDISSALENIYKVLKPQSKFATSVWDKPVKINPISLAMELAQKKFQLPPPLPGTPTLYGLADGIIEKAMKRAGFSNIIREDLIVNFKFDSKEKLIEYMHDIPAPIISILDTQTKEKQTEFWKDFSEASEQFVLEDGSVQTTSIAICVAGQKTN